MCRLASRSFYVLHLLETLIAQIPKEKSNRKSDVIVYEVFGLEDKSLPFSLTIIDSPGFGDTKGKDKDVLVSERLLDLFRSTDGVDEIDAVCLVLKASDNRLSDRLMYVFDSVVSLLGKDIEENIVLKHSDFVSAANVLQALKEAKMMCAKDEKDRPVHFMFNNIQKTERIKGKERALKQWFPNDTKSQKLETTVEVLNSRISLTACIHNLQERIEFIELKQREIQQTQEALKKHEQDMKNNKDFKVEVDEVYKCHRNELYCTVCTWKCHESKHVKTEQCTECEDKCSDPKHPKTHWIYVSKTRKVTRTEREMKAMYDKGRKDSEKSASLLETLQETIEDLQKEKDPFLEESFRHVVRLDEIAMKVVSLATQVHLDFLIDMMNEKGDTQKLMKLKEMKSKWMNINNSSHCCAA
ncbi:uncharacterized protein LOC117561834, partial [Gymnodraco acuticeps]|uniref:Uncharacterized protein LOC117561834 n=1 Tax=Gymnodraco acuticeps TaxID=8218 RepID=A0A6P8VW46_GYMAC